MQMTKANTAANSAIFGIYRLLIISFVLLTLYFAQKIVIPLVIAALLSFLLSPLVSLLERWLGRTLSIIFVVLVVFSLIGLLGYVFAKQLILFGSNIQNYNDNIQIKLESIRFPDWAIFDRIGQALSSLKESLFGTSFGAGTQAMNPDVKLIDFASNFVALIESFFGSFFSIVWSSGIVLLLVIFMLLNREDIRSRIIKVIGQRSISSTTSAMGDASERVFGYLFRQFIVNISFGFVVALGLYLIGIPNVILWGGLAAILRFIPYIGSWIAALLPIAFSFIVTDTWSVPILTVLFFVLIEIITAYVIEPYYYGHRTGVSSFALILATIFWTWLWGPIGLLLSIPLTVCLVVIGQHVTTMSFFSTLLSQEQALTAAEECYHRLLAYDSSTALDIVESFLKKDSVVSLYDSVLVPIMTQTETDFHLDLIDAEKRESVYQGIQEIIEFLSISEEKKESKETEVAPRPLSKSSVLCLPLHTLRDELGSAILTQLLIRDSFNVDSAKNLSRSETIESVEKSHADIVCIVAVAPFVLSQVRYLCTRIHQTKPKLPLVVCLCGFTEVSPEMLEKFNSIGLTKVVFSFSQAINTLEEIEH